MAEGTNFFMTARKGMANQAGMFSGELPEQIKVVFVVDTREVKDVLNVATISSYNRLIRLTARISSAFKGKPSFSNIAT